MIEFALPAAIVFVVMGILGFGITFFDRRPSKGQLKDTDRHAIN